jgi:hypothetical protein
MYVPFTLVALIIISEITLLALYISTSICFDIMVKISDDLLNMISDLGEENNDLRAKLRKTGDHENL